MHQPGVSSKKNVSIIFHITRLLADGVRLFATAIPLSFITGWDYWLSILVIGCATLLYTFYGGLRSVVVVDSVQLVLYLVCAVIGILIISQKLDLPLLNVLSRIPENSLKIFSSGLHNGKTMTLLPWVYLNMRSLVLWARSKFNGFARKPPGKAVSSQNPELKEAFAFDKH